MAEPIKGLADFGFNPMQMGMQMMQLEQNAQMMGLRQQQAQREQIQQELEASRLAIQNAAPDDQYRITKRVLELVGAPSYVMPDPNAFHANPALYQRFVMSPMGSAEQQQAALELEKLGAGALERSKKLAEPIIKQAAGKAVNIAAGKTDSTPGLDTAVAEIPAVASQAANVAYPTQLEQAKVKDIQTRQRQIQEAEANINLQASTLIGPKNQSRLMLNESRQFLDAYDNIARFRTKTKQDGPKNLEMATIPGFKDFEEGRLLMRANVDKELTQLKVQQEELAGLLEQANFGLPLPDGQTPQTLDAKFKASQLIIGLKERERDFLTNPSRDTHAAFEQAQLAVQQHVDALGQEKQQLAKSRLDLERTKFDAKATDAEVASAQKFYLDSGKNLQATMAKFPGVPGDKIREVEKDPNKAMVNVTMGQEKAEGQAVGAGFGKRYIEIQDSAVDAGGKLSKLSRMEQLLQGVETGKLTPTTTQIAAVAKSLGFDIDPNLDAKQAIDALSNEMALELRNPSGGAGMPGALSDQDRAFLANMTPGLSKTPGGNRIMIDTARKLEQRKQEIAKMARAYRRKHGQFDEGFLDELQEFSDSHPLFAPKEGTVQDGFRFKGGDPSKPENWEKQ